MAFSPDLDKVPKEIILTTKKGVQQIMKAPVTTEMIKMNLFSLLLELEETRTGESLLAVFRITPLL